MLSVSDLTYHIGGRSLYENTSIHLSNRDKIGLVGLNGSGKTTLLKIIRGEIKPERGSISKLKDCSIGILEQEIGEVNEDLDILEIAMTAFQPILDIKHKIDLLTDRIASEAVEKDIEKLAILQSEFEIRGGYALQSKAEEILEGIGFRTIDLQRPIREFSGGWKMRVMLAKLLLEKPSLLMLDEPTNHLDLPSIQWFENYLKSYEGAIILVSHDKQFIDNTVNKIIHIEKGKLNLYNGNYSFFLDERAMRMEIQQNAHANQQKKIKDAEKFINRFRAKSSKARQVQSKIKLMDKVELIENAKEDIKTIQFQFKFNQPSGKQVLEIKDLNKSYGNQKIFSQANANILRGDKIALIGANGLGKTTLLKIIAGIESFRGHCTDGYNVSKAYYAQHQVDSLHYKNDILEELNQLGSDYTELELRSILGSFLFSGDDVFKKIETLSGGEKARVALAKTLITRANFLILDEPTNHLDINSVEILSLAMNSYQGSLIMVSHDRSFIEQVANKIWFIEDCQIKEYLGSMEEYLYWANEIAMKKNKPEKVKAEKNKIKNEKQLTYEEQKEIRKNLKSLNRQLETIENKIDQNEKLKSAKETQLIDPDVFSDYSKLEKINQEIKQINQALSDLHNQWESLYVEIDSIEKMNL